MCFTNKTEEIDDMMNIDCGRLTSTYGECAGTRIRIEQLEAQLAAKEMEQY